MGLVCCGKGEECEDATEARKLTWSRAKATIKIPAGGYVCSCLLPVNRIRPLKQSTGKKGNVGEPVAAQHHRAKYLPLL